MFTCTFAFLHMLGQGLPSYFQIGQARVRLEVVCMLLQRRLHDEGPPVYRTLGSDASPQIGLEIFVVHEETFAASLNIGQDAQHPEHIRSCLLSLSCLGSGHAGVQGLSPVSPPFCTVFALQTA